MKAVSLILCALIGVALCGDYKTEEEVLVLTDDNFDAAVEEFSNVLVEFCKYTPTCFSC